MTNGICLPRVLSSPAHNWRTILRRLELMEAVSSSKISSTFFETKFWISVTNTALLYVVLASFSLVSLLSTTCCDALGVVVMLKRRHVTSSFIAHSTG